MDLDDTITVQVAALNYQGNQFKQMFEKELGKLCEVLYVDDFQSVFENLHENSKVKIPWKTCPYPKGPNEIYDYTLAELEKMLPPYVPGSENGNFKFAFFEVKKFLVATTFMA